MKLIDIIFLIIIKVGMVFGIVLLLLSNSEGAITNTITSGFLVLFLFLIELTDILDDIKSQLKNKNGL